MFITENFGLTYYEYVYKILSKLTIHQEIDSCGDTFPYYLVYLHGLNNHVNKGFCYLSVNVDDTVNFYTCENILSGYIEVLSSELVYISYFLPECVKLLSHDEKLQAKIAYDNWKQDMFITENFGLTYCEYMDKILSKLTIHQEIDSDGKSVNGCSNTVVNNVDSSKTNTCTNKKFQIPQFIEDTLSDDVDNKGVICDPNFPNKVRGFINHSSAYFTFIGPVKVADTIRNTGVPNYQSARFPLLSGLNIKAWERLLYNYPNKFLIQYIKFGFPLSICNHDNLKVTYVNNHHSATEHPQAVQDYINKELEYGALLGPVKHVTSSHFHCSPLLTRPKDDDKSRIILNLSHPQGQSLNDNVDKLRFDNRHFSLKLVSVDDIIQEILACDSPLIFKIDVSRAFRNLRVDPVDVLKLGISWNGSFYLHSAIAFGWMHGTSAYQMVADAIAHTITTRGGKILPYVDDFVVVSEEGIAKGIFCDLADIFTELGLPMNPDKKIPPSTSLTCLGITIDILNSTIAIDHQKLCAIYEECIRVHNKKYLSKRSPITSR